MPSLPGDLPPSADEGADDSGSDADVAAAALEAEEAAAAAAAVSANEAAAEALQLSDTGALMQLLQATLAQVRLRLACRRRRSRAPAA